MIRIVLSIILSSIIKNRRLTLHQMAADISTASGNTLKRLTFPDPVYLHSNVYYMCFYIENKKFVAFVAFYLLIFAGKYN